MAYVSEFLACIRHPDHEPGQDSTFHVVITDWQANVAGEFKPQTYGPVSPERAEQLGFNLDKIIGEVTAAAVRIAADNIERAEAAEKEVEAAKAEAADLMKAAQVAVQERDAAISYAGNAAREKADLEASVAALVSEVAALKAPAEKEGPENPMLNKITLGLFGN